MRVIIGRSSGPCTDKEVSSEFEFNMDCDLATDIIGMVNAASGEEWYIQIGDRPQVVPKVQKREHE